MLNKHYNIIPILVLDFVLTEIKSEEIIISYGYFTNETEDDDEYAISQVFYRINIKRYGSHIQ